MLNTFLLLEILWICLFWLCRGLWFITLAISKKYLASYLSVSHFSTMIFSSFFLKLVISPVISEFLLRFRCPAHRWRVFKGINAFNLAEILYYNRPSLVILVNETKYFQFQVILPTFHIAHRLFCLPRRLQDIIGRLLLENVLKTSCKIVLKTFFKTSWRRLENLFMVSWNTKDCYAEDVLENKKCLLGIDLHGLGENEKLLELFAYRSNSRVFYGHV